MRPTGSVAAEAFSAAYSTLRAHRLSARVRPAISYEAPPADLELPVRPVPASTIPTLEGVKGRSAVDLVEAAQVAMESNVGLNAIVEDRTKAALEEAAVLDDERRAGLIRGPLHGVPITVKDVIDVAGVPTRAGSDAYLDFPEVDAVGVARLRAAGAVVVAKVTTHEFALGVTSPQSRNPHDPSRIPGGSSGGSAIAVSTGIGLASLGTDTRASIRVPAALSGVVGFKPTFGVVPTDGVVTLSWTMDHVAPMASSVADVALLLDALGVGVGLGMEHPLASFAGAEVTGLRIGVPSAPFAGCGPSVAESVSSAVRRLTTLGCRQVEVDRPTDIDLDESNGAGLLISRSEAAAVHRSLGLDRSLYWQEVGEQLDLADAVTAADYLDAQRIRADLATELFAVFDDVDVLAMPTSPVVAPPVDDFARYLTVLSRNAIPWSLVGFPAVSIPCGVDADGLPIGIQLVAPPGHDAVLVAVGTALERLDPGVGVA